MKLEIVKFFVPISSRPIYKSSQDPQIVGRRLVFTTYFTTFMYPENSLFVRDPLDTWYVDPSGIVHSSEETLKQYAMVVSTVDIEDPR